MKKLLTILLIFFCFNGFGQKVLIDINKGDLASSPYFLFSNDSTFVFTALSDKGREPWISDGTPQGTHMIKDFNPGSGSSNNYQGMWVPGFGYLLINRPSNTWPYVYELWKTDGTDSGTVLLNGNFNYYLTAELKQAIVYKGKLFFMGSDNQFGPELWVSDGTASGTKIFKNIAPGDTGSAPNGFTILNDKLYFIASTRESGNELWVSDGTDTGTHMAFDLNPGKYNGIESNKQYNILSCNNKIFFSGSRGDSIGFELYETDGTFHGTMLYKDFSPQYLNSNLTLTKFDDSTFYINSFSDRYIFRIWECNGKKGGLTEIRFKNRDSSECYFYGAYQLKNKRLFYLYQQINGYELWTEQPDIRNMDLLIDTRPGSNSGCCFQPPTLSKGYAYYASSGDIGQNIWKTDGLNEHTRIILNLTPEHNLSKLIAINGHLMIFANFDKKYGSEVYYLELDTKINTEISKQNFSVYPNPVKAGGNLYFDPESTDSVKLFGMDGKLIMEAGSDSEFIIPQDIVPGPYFILALHSGYQTIYKLIIE